MRNVNQKNSTAKANKIQDMAALWIEQIEKLLPANLDESAKTKGALIRKRGIKSSSDLLKVLLIYAVSTMSMRMLSLCASVLGIANISDTAWRKRFTGAELWLAYILDFLLPKPLPQKDMPIMKRTVHLIDGSNIAESGQNGKLYRIHMSYNLNLSSMDDIKVTDNHTAESFKHCHIQKNDIYIADSGYGKVKLYDYIISRGADAVLRFTPHHVILLDSNGHRIDMTKKLDKNQQIIDFKCYAQYEKKQVPVRIVASQLPEDKKADVIKRKKRKASKNQTQKPMAETLVYAEWVIIMTSLDEAYSAKEILTIYKSRWQIELLFKRIKQHFSVTKIRPSSLKYGKALILLWLIIWALVEKQAYQAERYMIEKEMDMSRFYPWALTSFFFVRVKMIIESLWATLLDLEDDISIIAAKLQNHKQDRLNQYFYFHFCCFWEKTGNQSEKQVA